MAISDFLLETIMISDWLLETLVIRDWSLGNNGDEGLVVGSCKCNAVTTD